MCFPKGLHCLHKKNHALDEATTFRLISQSWANLNLYMGGTKPIVDFPNGLSPLSLKITTFVFHSNCKLVQFEDLVRGGQLF